MTIHSFTTAFKKSPSHRVVAGRRIFTAQALVRNAEANGMTPEWRAYVDESVDALMTARRKRGLSAPLRAELDDLRQLLRLAQQLIAA